MHHLSKAGEWFWGAFILFIIVVALIYYGAVRCANCKTRTVLFNQYVLIFLGFVLFATAAFLSGMPVWHAVIAIIIFEIIIAFVVACRRGAFRRYGSCDSSASNASDCSGSNYRSGRRGYCWNWRLFLYRIFWDFIGYLFGIFLREIQLPKGHHAWYPKGVVAAWWVAAFVALALIGLIWQIGWSNACNKARCVMLNRRTWVVLWFVIGWFLGAVSGASWWFGLLIILVWSAIRWGLGNTFCFFKSCRDYYWQVIVVFFIAFILGSYCLRYLQLAPGAYLECGPVFHMSKKYF